MFSKRIAIAVIIASQEAMEPWRLFFQYLLKSIGDTELAIDHNRMAVPDAHPLGFNNSFMATSRNGTEIVLINNEILRRDLL